MEKLITHEDEHFTTCVASQPIFQNYVRRNLLDFSNRLRNLECRTKELTAKIWRLEDIVEEVVDSENSENMENSDEEEVSGKTRFQT